MTDLKIESKLTHPSLTAFPTLPPPPGSLHPIMKCKLLPLCIPPRGMSQLPCKLESEGLLIVLCQTKAVSKQKWSSFRPVVIWAYRAGDLEGNYCCRCCVTRLECLKAPSWGPTFVSFFHSLCGDCVHVCVCVPMCGP